MKIKFERQVNLKPGDIFKHKPSGCYILVTDNGKSVKDKDKDMTPIRFVNIESGHCIARNTSIGLCERDLNLYHDQIEVLGKMRIKDE
jgi:hypothetical protein